MLGVSPPQARDFNAVAEIILGSFYVRSFLLISFYDIDEDYVRWLQKIDCQIPNITYRSNSKFLCGTVFEIGDVKYYAPISSNKTVFRTSFPIKDNSLPSCPILSTIRFCFMIPAIESVLTKKDFRVIRINNSNYANLLEKEWNYCKTNEALIKKKALSVYNIGCNKNHKLNYTCCDFKKLEYNYMNYFN